MSIYDKLREVETRNMSMPAIVYLGKRITYYNLFSMVDSLSKNLKDIGIKKNDKVALIAGNSVQFAVSLLALYKIGAISFFLNDHDEPENYGIDEVITSCYNYRNLKGNYKNVIVIRDEDFGPFGTSISKYFLERNCPDKIKWSDSVVKFSSLIFDNVNDRKADIGPDDVIISKYTKKENKIYGIREKNIEAAISLLDSVFSNYKKNVAICSSLRKISSVNFLIFSLINGGTATIMPDNYPVPESVKIINNSDSNIVCGDPFFYMNVIKALNKNEFKKIRFFIMPGQHMKENFYSDFFKKTGKAVIEGYDITGATGLVALNDLEKPTEGSSGKILDKISYKIAGVADDPMNGILQIKSDTVCANTDEDGYFNTLDSITVNDESFIFIKESTENIINGTIFSYEDIENTVKKSGLAKDLASALVDGEYSREIKLFISGKDRGNLKKIKAYCRDNLPYYLIPSHYGFIDKIPRSPAGKIMRGELK
ncbi:MAG: AMP-binding protein [Thermoplasmata archaeon]